MTRSTVLLALLVAALSVAFAALAIADAATTASGGALGRF